MAALPKIKPTLALPFDDGDESLTVFRNKLTTSRPSVATRVNKFGQVEVCDNTLLGYDSTGNGEVDNQAGTGTAIYGDAINTIGKNEPRIDYDPVTGECLGVLIEEERTNLFLNSDTLATQSVAVTSQAYTVSFYGTGTITFSDGHSATLVGTGANERVSVTFTPTTNGVTCTISGTVNNGQFQAGSSPTSYIPTNGTPVIRSADDISIEGTKFSSFYNQNEGTFLMRGIMPKQNGTLFTLSDNTTSNRLTVKRTAVDTLSILSESGDTIGINNTTLLNSPIDGSDFKLGITYKNDTTIEICINGSSVQTLTGAYAKNFDRVYLGANATGNGEYWNSQIKAEIYYHKAQATTILESLTKKSIFD